MADARQALQWSQEFKERLVDEDVDDDTFRFFQAAIDGSATAKIRDQDTLVLQVDGGSFISLRTLKTLHADQAQIDWSGYCNTLRLAWLNSDADTTAPASLGLRHRPKDDSSSGKALAEERATASATVSGPQREPEKNIIRQAISTDSEQFLREDSTVNPSDKTTSGRSGEDSG